MPEPAGGANGVTSAARGGRQRRTLLFGGGAVLSILLAGRAVPAWRDALRERRVAAAEAQGQWVTATGALARHVRVRDTLRARQARLDAVAATLVPGTDEGAAGRALAAMVAGAASGAGVRVTSTAVLDANPRLPGRAVGEPVPRAGHRLPETATDDRLLRTVAVRVVGAGDVRGVTTLLQTLERGPMRLAVRSLAITQPAVAAGDERPEQLQLEMVVEGLAIAHDGTSGRPAPVHTPP